MSGARRGWMLLVVLVAMMAGWANLAEAQIATTTVQDTVYSANGTPASGTVLVSWNAFTTAGGQSVPSGTASATIGAGGLLTIALAPNAGSTPMGSYYTAVYHLSDGTTSREYWVVPVTVPGGGPTTLAAIKSQVLPISVAMQTVSKQYVDNAIAAVQSGAPLSTNVYVPTAGGTMTGPLVFPADPVSPNQAADKHYVDINVAATAAGMGQKVSQFPGASQVVSQPSGTSFGIAGTYGSTTFASAGTTSQTTVTSATTAASPSVTGYTQFTNSLNCFEPGFDLGNNGTSANGWSTCALEADTEESATRGISQLHTGDFSHFAQGDTAAYYTYLTSFGGSVASSDEAVTHTVDHTDQIGYYTGVIATGGVTGSNLLTTNSMSCHGFCITLQNNQFADGGILLDTSKGGSTATLAAEGEALNGMYYTLGSGTVTPSIAWGNILLNSCTNNGNGQWQNYTATTCNVTLGTSPASPGSFVAGQDIYLSGPFEEEAAVVAVGVPSGGVQSITFNTRYAWNSTWDSALVMQGGPGGQSIVATNRAATWPIAYAVVGATSPTQVFFSNCLSGSCNGVGVGAGNILQASVLSFSGVLAYGESMVRTNNVVTMSGMGPKVTYFPVGSTIVVTGASPSDLNGTYTVATNSEDGSPGSVANITWAQTGADETATALGTISSLPESITFYPSAFITGTNNGVSGNVQLATNTVPFAVGDVVAGAPTSEFQNSGLNLYIGQTTPVDGSRASQGIMVFDNGPTQLSRAYAAINKTTNGIAGQMFYVLGSYANDFYFGYRPANNGSILYVQGGEPVSTNAKPYYIFTDNAVGGSFGFNPQSGGFSLSGNLGVPSITATTGASKFALGSTIGGVLPCLQNGTNCPASGGGTGTVSSVAAGTWPSWLTPTVTNATTTPTVAVAASAIPNVALANSATTVNGQTCALGGTCTIATGSSTPPLTYVTLHAAVSSGGVGFSGAFGTYNANAPTIGSVNPATTTDGYMLFAATPTSPQYAQTSVELSPYWTSSPAATGLWINFYSTSTSGNSVMDVQTACVVPGQAIGSPTWTTAIVTTTAVAGTANTDIQTAFISGIAAPGANSCPATGMTTPTKLLIRVYAATTSAVPTYVTGATLVYGRSQ